MIRAAGVIEGRGLGVRDRDLMMLGEGREGWLEALLGIGMGVFSVCSSVYLHSPSHVWYY